MQKQNIYLPLPFVGISLIVSSNVYWNNFNLKERDVEFRKIPINILFIGRDYMPKNLYEKLSTSVHRLLGIYTIWLCAMRISVFDVFS